MKKRDWLLIVVWIVSAVMLVVSMITLSSIASLKSDLRSMVQEQLDTGSRKMIDELKSDIRSETPIKGINYSDGKDGKDGKDGVSTNGKDGKDGKDGTSVKGDKGDKGESVKGDTGATGAPGQSIKGDTGEKGEKGDPGETPLIRCNVVKNRWEVRYSEEASWKILNDETVPCTITKHNSDD